MSLNFLLIPTQIVICVIRAVFGRDSTKIPGTNTVAELDGKSGGGTEFKTNVPLIPYKCEVITE